MPHTSTWLVGGAYWLVCPHSGYFKQECPYILSTVWSWFWGLADHVRCDGRTPLNEDHWRQHLAKSNWKRNDWFLWPYLIRIRKLFLSSRSNSLFLVILDHDLMFVTCLSVFVCSHPFTYLASRDAMRMHFIRPLWKRKNWKLLRKNSKLHRYEFTIAWATVTVKKSHIKLWNFTAE